MGMAVTTIEGRTDEAIYGASNNAHVIEVNRWVRICMDAVLTGEAKGAYSAAISLLCVAQSHKGWKEFSDPFQLSELFDSEEQATDFMQDSVQNNCAHALSVFQEAFPNGYPEG